MRQVININRTPSTPSRNVGGNVFFVVVTGVWPTARSFHLLANKLSIGASAASTSLPQRVVERHVGGELIWRKGLFARKWHHRFQSPDNKFVAEPGKIKKIKNKNCTSPSCGCGFTHPDCTISLHVTAFYRRWLSINLLPLWTPAPIFFPVTDESHR